MPTAKLLRLLLAAVLALSCEVESAGAQCETNLSVNCGPPPTRGPPPSHHNNVVWYVVGGVAAGVLGWIIGSKVFSNPNPPDGTNQFPGNQPPPTPASLPLPTLPPVYPPPNLPAGPPGGGPLRNGFNLPPAGETRFVPDEVMLDIPSSVTEQTLDAIAARHRMTRLETQTFGLTGRTLHRWHLDAGGSVPDMIRGLSGETNVAGAQPNYIYIFAQTAASEPINPDQYAPEKLKLPEAHRLATGERILVAIIDSGVDASHPDLNGAIVGNFDAAGDGAPPHPHGTGMAGAIAARRTIMSSAPRVGLLTIRAFSTKTTDPEATTFNIMKGLDWAADQGARIINMSFAGPADPRIRDALSKATKRGIVLVAAAGNAGPRSPPLYPAADPGVIAVTATDMEDAVFTGANRGTYIAVAAPGVDVLVPAPKGTYQFTTGTSVAAAEISGVAALLLERNPSLTPSDIRKILIRTATALGPKGHERDFGAGLVNALQAVSSARPR